MLTHLEALLFVFPMDREVSLLKYISSFPADVHAMMHPLSSLTLLAFVMGPQEVVAEKKCEASENSTIICLYKDHIF